MCLGENKIKYKREEKCTIVLIQQVTTNTTPGLFRSTSGVTKNSGGGQYRNQGIAMAVSFRVYGLNFIFVENFATYWTVEMDRYLCRVLLDTQYGALVQLWLLGGDILIGKLGFFFQLKGLAASQS